MSTAAASMNSNGRIWIYKSKHNTPFPSTLKSMKDASSVIKCPLPKMTPTIPPENRLHKSNIPLKLLYQSKYDFYLDQFNERVSKADVDRIERRTIVTDLHETELTIYKPNDEKLQGICLHVHGGGWLWGDSQYQVAHRCMEMAKHLNAAVVSVEYSLVHRSNFNPVKDVFAALKWVEYFGPEELNTKKRLIASGESSGAHLLMLAMLHRRNDEDHKKKLKDAWMCLNLVYGVFDLSGSPSVRNDGVKSSPLSGDELLWMYDLYCKKVQRVDEDLVNRKDPAISPLYANLSSMPPALFSVGTADPLLDDSLMTAAKYCRSSNDVEFAMYEDGEHGIGHFGLQEDDLMGDQARQYTLDFMKRHLDID